MLERSKMLVNEDKLNKFTNTHVLIVGVGGVGGYAIETLIRSGIEKNYIQRWIPIVAAEQMANGKEEEVEFLSQWIDVLDYE